MYSNIDGFRMFMPITDFEETVSKYIGGFLTTPIDWKYEAVDNLKQKSINKIKREFNKLILSFIRNKLIVEPCEKWKESYFLAGTGSTISRKREITTILVTQLLMPPKLNTLRCSRIKLKRLLSSQ